MKSPLSLACRLSSLGGSAGPRPPAGVPKGTHSAHRWREQSSSARGPTGNKDPARAQLRRRSFANRTPFRRARRRAGRGAPGRGGPDPAGLRACSRARVRGRRRGRHAARPGVADHIRRRLRPPRGAKVLGRQPARRLGRVRARDGAAQRTVPPARGGARRHGRSGCLGAVDPSPAFALFCFTLAISLRTLGVGADFALATAVALLTQAFVLSLALRTRVSEAAPAGSGRASF